MQYSYAAIQYKMRRIFRS